MKNFLFVISAIGLVPAKLAIAEPQKSTKQNATCNEAEVSALSDRLETVKMVA